MNDAVDYGVEVFQDFSSGNAEGVKADFCQALVTDCVPLRAISTAVEFAVYFDRQTRGEAGEVETIANLRVLAAEQESARFLAELLPEQDFGE